MWKILNLSDRKNFVMDGKSLAEDKPTEWQHRWESRVTIGCLQISEVSELELKTLRSIYPADKCYIDWHPVSPETVDAFWATHQPAMILIRVNDTHRLPGKNRDIKYVVIEATEKPLRGRLRRVISTEPTFCEFIAPAATLNPVLAVA